MLNIASVAEEYNRLRAALLAEFPELANDAGALSDTLDGLNDASDTVASLIIMSREADAHAVAVKGLASDYESRAARHTARAKRLKQAALSLLEAMGEEKITRPELTASITHRKGTVEVYDPEQLPEQFFRYTRSVDGAALREAAEAGQIPAGARMTNGSTHLTVRVR